ncbi:MAG: hypothetical protein KAZ30_02455 [Candidatus Magasanikbacteria bacterium]|nr:hypothetical protein [Candidatus Magasanikbacteria bacterium]
MSKHTKQVTGEVTLTAISDLLNQKLAEKLDQKFDEKLSPIIETLSELKSDVTDLKEDMSIVKEFLTTEVMTKTDGRQIMAIVNRHTKEIKQLQAIANY